METRGKMMIGEKENRRISMVNVLLEEIRKNNDEIIERLKLIMKKNNKSLELKMEENKNDLEKRIIGSCEQKIDNFSSELKDSLGLFESKPINKINETTVANEDFIKHDQAEGKSEDDIKNNHEMLIDAGITKKYEKTEIIKHEFKKPKLKKLNVIRFIGKKSICIENIEKSKVNTIGNKILNNSSIIIQQDHHIDYSQRKKKGQSLGVFSKRIRMKILFNIRRYNSLVQIWTEEMLIRYSENQQEVVKKLKRIDGERCMKKYKKKKQFTT